MHNIVIKNRPRCESFIVIVIVMCGTVLGSMTLLFDIAQIYFVVLRTLFCFSIVRQPSNIENWRWLLKYTRWRDVCFADRIAWDRKMNQYTKSFVIETIKWITKHAFIAQTINHTFVSHILQLKNHSCICYKNTEASYSWSFASLAVTVACFLLQSVKRVAVRGLLFARWVGRSHCRFT